MNHKDPRKKFFLCYFESTRRCNLKCRYCMTKGRATRHGPHHRTFHRRDKAPGHRRGEEVLDNGAVAYSGGEHLLRKDALEILKYTGDAGLWSFINTNGSMLTTRLLKEIKEATGGKLSAFSH